MRLSNFLWWIYFYLEEFQKYHMCHVYQHQEFQYEKNLPWPKWAKFYLPLLALQIIILGYLLNHTLS